MFLNNLLWGHNVQVSCDTHDDVHVDQNNFLLTIFFKSLEIFVTSFIINQSISYNHNLVTLKITIQICRNLPFLNWFFPK